ncbi:hypothetical protein GCM10023074_40320 [Microbispora amethystogenes]|uniref:Uncharacterized protein n=1 Tax=Microbispora amethystogenes TaxID=1427754 RepID=A0ABQ4FD24_9ACTN|nr:hypothetical protein Mam01_28760 [Microbispora amethystogenes]
MKEAEKEVPRRPDTEAVYWTLTDIAGFLNVQVNTARVYNARASLNRRKGTPKPGDLPKPDAIFGRSPVWKPATIIAWSEERPGMGVGGGRPPKDHSE